MLRLQPTIRTAGIRRARSLWSACCVAGMLLAGLAASRSLDQHVPPAEIPATDLAALLPAPQPSAGSWKFAGCDWRVQTLTVSDDEVQQVMTEVEQIESAAANVELPLASRWVALAENYSPERSIDRDHEVFRWDTNDVRGRMVTDRSQPPRLLAAALALRGADNSWQLHELLAGRDSGAAAAVIHLLPLPAAATGICQRHSLTGELLLELVTVSGGREKLLQSWQQAGWDVRHTDWGSAGSFSFLCARPGTVVYAWSATAQPQTLMLSRTTTSEQGSNR